MFNVAKYIRTAENNIIVFPCTLTHSDFINFNPESAGFIKISTNVNNCSDIEVVCECYGESISLNLKGDPKFDSKLAYNELINTQK